LALTFCYLWARQLLPGTLTRRGAEHDARTFKIMRGQQASTASLQMKARMIAMERSSSADRLMRTISRMRILLQAETGALMIGTPSWRTASRLGRRRGSGDIDA